MLLLASFNFSAKALAAQPHCTYRYRRESVKINDRSITVEEYLQDGYRTYPLVFMIHGSAGAFTPLSAGEPQRDNFGEKDLAANCFVVILPHYLEAFGIKSLTSVQDMTRMFPQLLAVNSTLLSRAEALQSVKGRPVFLFDESLGGYLSVALALRRPEISALSEMSGGIPKGYAVTNPHRFAVRIFHGDDDTFVPTSEANDLERYCLVHTLRVEKTLYPGVNHYFPYDVRRAFVEGTIEFFQQIDGCCRPPQ